MSTHQSYNLNDLIGHLKTLTPPLHFNIEPTEETLLINLRPEGELTYQAPPVAKGFRHSLMEEDEFTVQTLTNLRISKGRPPQTRTHCSLFMVTDIDGYGTQWTLLNEHGIVLSTGYSIDPNHGS